MRFDVSLPIIGGSESRDETLLVFFEGFIKNPSEGIVRTMLRDIEDWLFFYPQLPKYEKMNSDELYESTMLYRPMDLLTELSEGKREPEDMMDDLFQIQEEVILENSKITSFEFALYRILENDFVKKCYFYKDGMFFDNEIDYIVDKFEKFMYKIEIIDSFDFPSVFHALHPTTIFLTDPAFIFDYVANHVSEDESNKMVFVLLNTIQTVEMVSESNYKYTEKFQTSMEISNQTKFYGVSATFNFAIDDDEDDNESEEEVYG